MGRWAATRRQVKMIGFMRRTNCLCPWLQGVAAFCSDRCLRIGKKLFHSKFLFGAARDAAGRPICQFVARRPLIPVLGLGLPVAWVSRTWAEPDVLRLRFQHLGGATRGMDVTWRIEPQSGGARVTIEHRFAPRVAVWAVVVDRLFTGPIAGRTLRTFKTLAEALADR